MPEPPAPPDTPAPTTTGGVPVVTCSDVAEAAEEIIGTRCAACHGPGSPEFGGFGDALDRDALVEGGWVTPGDPVGSRILVSISDDSMPPPSGGGPLSEPEKDLVAQWIVCGAEDWGTVASTRGFLSPEMVFQSARNDVSLLPLEDQRNARWLSLVHLYDAGVPADRILLYGTALTKLVWSLTAERGVPELVPVNLDGLVLADGTVVRVADDLGSSLLFRVDLEAFGWDGSPVDTWEELVSAWPFGVRYDNELDPAEEVVILTGSRLPVVNGDWFAANASLPPLYFDVLDVPATRDAFLSKFGGILDASADFLGNNVDCVGVDGYQTLVSESNRVLCRHDAIPGYCWQTFDFGSVAGLQNVFVNPTGFLTANDGGEVLCSLRSGQQVYGVFDALGNRLDNAPIGLVSDYNPDSGALVKTGLHCIRCHEAGIVLRSDQIRDTVLVNESNFDDAVVDQVLEWFPPNADMADIQQEDVAAFVASLDVPLGEEPIWALAQDYEAPLSAARVAAELGLAEGALFARLATDEAIGVQYTSLYGEGGTLDRGVFEGAARDTICALEAGDVCAEDAFCGLSSAPCPEGSVCDALGRCSRIE